MIEPFRLKSFLTGEAAQNARVNLSNSYAAIWNMHQLAELAPELMPGLSDIQLGYPGLHGSLSLRTGVAAFLGQGLSAENILVTNGADDALALMMMTFLGPGDRVILQSPAYPTIKALARWRGAEVVEWSCEETECWAPSLDRLKVLCTKPARIIMLATPHNPTGCQSSKSELDGIAECARNCGAIMVSDEVYSGLNHDGSQSISALASGDDTIVVGSLSKAFGLPGLRVGWIATKDKALLDELKSLRDYMNSFVPSPVEFIATQVLAHREILLLRNRYVARKNRTILEQFMVKHKELLSGSLPNTGVVCFLRWTGTGNAREISKWLLEDHKMLLVSSEQFGFGEDHIRIGFGGLDFTDALSELDRILSSLAKIS